MRRRGKIREECAIGGALADGRAFAALPSRRFERHELVHPRTHDAIRRQFVEVQRAAFGKPAFEPTKLFGVAAGDACRAQVRA